MTFLGVAAWCHSGTKQGSNGITSEYYDSVSYTNHKVTRTDSQYDGSITAPPTIESADGWSIIFSAHFVAPTSGTYTFSCDAGVGSSMKFRIGATYVATDVHPDAGNPTQTNGAIALVGGSTYNLAGLCSMNHTANSPTMSWKRPGDTSFSTVASSSLTPAVVAVAPMAMVRGENASELLSWAAVVGAASYNAYRAPAAGMENFDSAANSSPITGTGTVSYTDGGLAAGSTYFYQVK